MNWLCNPTGKPGQFRGVDWVVERLNLYIKAWHGGSFSNRTMPRIIKESPLVETYRKMHVNIEENFYLENRTIRHSPPDMPRTLAKLSTSIQESGVHQRTSGQHAKYIVPDKVTAGMNSALNEDEDDTELDDEFPDEVAEAEDYID